MTPETYLEKELDVSFPNRSEIMKVALRGSEPEELKTVVNAVINAYLEEFNTTVSSEKAYNLQELQKRYNSNLELIQEQEEEIHGLSDTNRGRGHVQDRCATDHRTGNAT